jgi:hypothetical protein
MEVTAHDWFKNHTILIDGESGEERLLRPEGGFSRKILFVKNLVIKITQESVDDNRWDQSTNEFKIWQTLMDEDRKHFAEVVDGGKVMGMNWSWVAQRYLNFENPWMHCVPPDIQALIESLKVRYNLLDIYGSYCGRNWGVVNGTPVIYDYGSLDAPFNRHMEE